MATQEMMPFWRVVEQLRHYCAERLTGTVFIVSDDNRMAQVQLDGGNIVMLLCRGRRGLDALAAMRTMPSARLRFDASVAPAGETEHFNTSEIIDRLGISVAGTAPVSAAVRPAPASAAASQAPGTLARLERMLVHYIGPMAQIVCADYASHKGDMRSLVLALASEVPDQRQADAFRAEAAQALGLGSL